jgi:hypothetical protein
MKKFKMKKALLIGTSLLLGAVSVGVVATTTSCGIGTTNKYSIIIDGKLLALHQGD